jgi:hypothetical protein
MIRHINLFTLLGLVGNFHGPQVAPQNAIDLHEHHPAEHQQGDAPKRSVKIGASFRNQDECDCSHQYSATKRDDGMTKFLLQPKWSYSFDPGEKSACENTGTARS